MKRKPIKRHEHLVSLSREHHTGLLCCWKIRQGLRKQVDTGRIKNYILYFWENHLQQHLLEEEEHLFKKVNDALCRKALKDHEEIQKLINQVRANEAKPEILTQVADFLDAHIRFEERELFPHLEKAIPEQELKHIGAVLTKIEASSEKDDFPDEFWVK